jgi:hypothetical protein
MFKISQDKRVDRYIINYCMDYDLVNTLYTIENVEWIDVGRHTRSEFLDNNDLQWVKELVDLNKQVSISDTGTWSIL